MAVTAGTLRLLRGLQVSVLQQLDAADEAILTAWGTSWNELAHEWELAVADLVTASQGGRWPSAAQIGRAQRVRNAVKVTRDALVELARDMPVMVTDLLPDATADAVAWQDRLLVSQMPAELGSAAAVIRELSRVNPDALDAIIRRTTGRVTSLARPLSGQAEAAMRAALIRGVAVGDDPRKVAADMLARVHGAFNGGRTRALVIARTEFLDAHRAASRAQNVANADVLAGWEWCSARDRRTCPACFGKDGTVHDLDEQGPNGHQQCRCVRLPVAKSWQQLGFHGLTEPVSVRPSARDVFDQMPAADQLQVMGRARLDLLQSGRVGWSDLAVKRTTPGWRDSWVPAPVSALA